MQFASGNGEAPRADVFWQWSASAFEQALDALVEFSGCVAAAFSGGGGAFARAW